MNAPATGDGEGFEGQVQDVIDRFESQWESALAGDEPPDLDKAVTNFKEPQ